MSTHAPLWLDVDSSDPDQHAILANSFGFHALAIEDTFNAHTRVKIDAYGVYLFIVMHARALASAVR